MFDIRKKNMVNPRCSWQLWFWSTSTCLAQSVLIPKPNNKKIWIFALQLGSCCFVQYPHQLSLGWLYQASRQHLAISKNALMNKKRLNILQYNIRYMNILIYTARDREGRLYYFCAKLWMCLKESNKFKENYVDTHGILIQWSWWWYVLWLWWII